MNSTKSIVKKIDYLQGDFWPMGQIPKELDSGNLNKFSFPELTSIVLQWAREKHSDFNSRYEGFGVLLKEWEQLKNCIFSSASSDAVLLELASVAAVCQRIAEDVEYDR